MSSKRIDTVTKDSVIAISREENKLRGVELRKHGEVFEVLWAKDGEASEMDLGTFAIECDVSLGRGTQGQIKDEKIVAVGFDSSSVVFYRLSVPAVREKELGAIVELQAEARLPLPAEQMELAWRRGEVRNGQVGVTIAAAKREHLQKFVEDVRGFEPAKILLDCEAIVKVWGEFFSGDEAAVVVVSIRSRSTQVCLAEEGKLVNAVSLDMGMEDFLAGEKSGWQIETAERFVQDMRSVLKLFDYAGLGELPIFVLSDGGSAIEEIASCLESAGLKTQVAVPQMQKLTAQTEMKPEDIYEYRVPIGLAAMAFEAPAEELNVFAGLYRPEVEKEKRHWLHLPKVTGAIAAVMLALLVTVLYAVDVVNEKRLTRLAGKVDMRQFTQRQKLIKSVALQRPDLLRLLTEMNSTEHEGIVLSSVHFKKGNPVTVKGQADGEEQIWKFQASLNSKKGIENALIESITPKDDKREFTINFHYGRFTQKKSQLRG
jgi:hypothetical protein